MRVMLIGFGGVAQALVRLLDARRTELYRAHGLSPRLVGVIDSRGAAVSESGLQADALLTAKRDAGSVAAVPGHGLPNPDIDALIVQSDADVVIEATPSRVDAPQASMRHLQAAFRSGKHAISVNKAPLAVGMPALLELAEYNGVQFRFSGTVGAGTPMLAFARECASGDEITNVRAILNGTTNFILSRMRERGESFDASLAEATRLGYAETDPSTDVDGIDTATKIVIFANHVLGRRVRISDVAVTGIRGVTAAAIADAASRGQVVKLIGEISEHCSVAPREVPADSPLNVPANLNALALTLRNGGDVTLVGRGAGGVETATAIVRDMIDIWHCVGGR